jgi:alpha-D-ribose 1-methylphosphonate 5-triphosphate diphosphatase PhnM
VVDLAHGTVESDDGETMIGGIEDQVLSHDSETNEAEITAGNGRMLADIDASKTCAKVSRRTHVNVVCGCWEMCRGRRKS